MRKQIRIAALGGVAAVLLSVTGCATFGVFETAQTAPPGGVQVGGAITPLNIVSTEGSDGYGHPTESDLYSLFIPFASLFAKVGVSDRVDLGATWTFGNAALFLGSYGGYSSALGPQVGLNGKYQFLRGATDGALLLSGSYYGIASEGYSVSYYSIGPRFLFSSERQGSFPYMLNVGASYAGMHSDGEGSPGGGGAFAALTGAGLPFRLGTNRNVRIMPELQLSIPLSSEESWSEIGFPDAFVASFGVSLGYVGAERSEEQ
jgi:hypothetical protein